MRRISRRMPTPSMAVAFIALLAALGGTAAALPGSNTVTSGDIKRGAVGTSDIKNNSVRSGDIRNSTVRGRDVRNNTLTGADINESSLGIVPSANAANAANVANVANSANNAQTTDGQSLAKFAYRANTDSGSRTVLNFGGLVLVANCDADDLDVIANPTSAGILHSFDKAGNNLDEDTFDPGDDVDILSSADSNAGTLTFSSVSGHVVSVTYLSEEDADFDCEFHGTAVGS